VNVAIFSIPLAILTASACLGGAQPTEYPADTAAIMEADRSFNRAVADRDTDRFRSFIAEGATFNGGTPEEIRGHDRIVQEWAPYFAADGPRLTWTPTAGEVIGGGDLGLTVGDWERRGTSPTGAPTTSRGQYLTIWRKQSDRSWKIVYDTGSTRP
jgi:ketosteroid isomerase-like protein